MNKEEIMEAIKSLAHSQGFYGRLYETLKENPESLNFLKNRISRIRLIWLCFWKARKRGNYHVLFQEIAEL